MGADAGTPTSCGRVARGGRLGGSRGGTGDPGREAALGALLGLWHSKLKPDGRLVLADVIPHDNAAIDDVKALLAFAWQGGFLTAALLGLVRTALSPYRKLRAELGLAEYGEAEMIGILRDHGFAAHRRDENIGHNPKRMTFVARPA